MYFEVFDDPLAAIAREKQFKKWRRGWKVALIERDNPERRYLAEEFASLTQASSRTRQSRDPGP